MENGTQYTDNETRMLYSPGAGKKEQRKREYNERLSGSRHRRLSSSPPFSSLHPNILHRGNQINKQRRRRNPAEHTTHRRTE